MGQFRSLYRHYVCFLAPILYAMCVYIYIYIYKEEFSLCLCQYHQFENCDTWMLLLWFACNQHMNMIVCTCFDGDSGFLCQLIYGFGIVLNLKQSFKFSKFSSGWFLIFWIHIVFLFYHNKSKLAHVTDICENWNMYLACLFFWIYLNHPASVRNFVYIWMQIVYH